jgi:hypothetical protein
MKLPGVPGEVWFGFSNKIPTGLSERPSPEMISKLIGFPTKELDQPQAAPAGVLVRCARKYGPEVFEAVDTAARLAADVPAALRAQAWTQAHRIAAAEAIEGDPAQADNLRTLSRHCLRYARRYDRKAKRYERQPEPPPAVLDVLHTPEEPEPAAQAEAPRWRPMHERDQEEQQPQTYQTDPAILAALTNTMNAVTMALQHLAALSNRPAPDIHVHLPEQKKIIGIKRDKEGNMRHPIYEGDDEL